MQTQPTFIDSIKYQLQHGGTTIQLIFINVALFFGIRILDILSELMGASSYAFIDAFVNPVFSLHTSFMGFITHPWTLFTYMFAHYSFSHLLWNMVFLYFAGKLFEQLFSQKRLIYTYILGGILGGLLEVFAHAVFPKLQMSNDMVIGASGSIMAIFIAIAFYRPNTKVNLFGILPVKIIFLALAFILMDIFNLSSTDGTAHFAHLGGAIFGVWSIQNLQSPTNIISFFERLVYQFKLFFSKKKQPRMKVKKGGRSAQFKSDEDYNAEKKKKQEVIDKILDKISKSGYESLTKKEKDILFKQSKR